MEATKNIDWDLLGEQKLTLVNVLNDVKLTETQSDDLNGILNLLDAMTDEVYHKGIEKRGKMIHMTTWIQDNYSQNTKQGGKEMLPKGTMRMDFTDEHFSMAEIIQRYEEIFGGME